VTPPAFKEDPPPELCPGCKGLGQILVGGEFVKCPRCNGTGTV
jgi:DnaJ-class molecular chaperone